MNSYKRKKSELEDLEEQRIVLENDVVGLSEDDELVKNYNKIIEKMGLLQRTLEYLEEQIEYIDTTTSNIGHNKNIVFSKLSCAPHF